MSAVIGKRYEASPEVERGFREYYAREFPEKADAITSFGENILLSAGAGCGKTLALSQRVLFQVAAEGLSVSDMLILTFTENAAAEMRTRIQATLRDAADDRESFPFLSETDRERLREEAAKVPTASISTFDSFANSLVRRYADRLGVSPTFTVLSEPAADFVFSTALDEVVAGEFQSGSESIQAYYRDVFDRSGDTLRGRVKQFERARSTLTDPDALLDPDTVSPCWTDSERLKTSYVVLYREVESRLRYLCGALRELERKKGVVTGIKGDGKSPEKLPLFSSIADILEERMDEIDRAIDRGEDPSELIRKLGDSCYRTPSCRAKGFEQKDAVIASFSFGQGAKDDGFVGLRRAKRNWTIDDGTSKGTAMDADAKARAKTLKEAVEGCLSSLHSDRLMDSSKAAEFMQATAEQGKYLIELDLRAREELLSYKSRSGSYTFKDIADMCLRLLETDRDVRETERARISSIMVDEYQDSSYDQERLISILGTDEVSYQRYLSGDEKGDTKLLFSRRICFMVGDVKQSIYGFRKAEPELFLSKYRSPEEHSCRVIPMTTNYRSQESVVDLTNRVFSRLMTVRSGGIDYAGDSKQHIRASNEDLRDGTPASEVLPQGLYVTDEDLKSIGATRSALRRSLMGEMAAQEIEKLMADKGLTLLDKHGCEHPVTYSSFAVLVRDSTTADQICGVLAKHSIPFVSEINASLSGGDAALVSASLIRLESLLLRMRTEWLTEEDMRIFKRAVLSVDRSFLIRSSDADVARHAKWLNGFWKNRWKKAAETPEVLRKLDRVNSLPDTALLPPVDLFARLCDEFDMENRIADLLDTEENLVSYRWVFSRVQELSNSGESLDFIADFLASRTTAEEGIKRIASTRDAVVVTTIHKSKGLEYPIVLFPAMRSSKRRAQTKSDFTFDDELGVFTAPASNRRFTAPGKDTPILPTRLACGLRDESRRSQEELRLLYVAMTRAVNAFIALFPYDASALESSEYPLPIFPRQPADFLALATADLKLERFEVGKLTADDLASDRVVKKRDYPVDKGGKSSVQVTLGKRDIPDDLWAAPAVSGKASKGSVSVADYRDEEFGTRVHEELSQLDWSEFPSLPSVEFVSDQRERGLVERFVNSELISAIAKLSGGKAQIYQEYRYLDPATSAVGSIDFLAVYDGGAVIVDYKTSDVDEPEYDRQLKVYREAVEREFGLPEESIGMYLYSLVKGTVRQVQ